MDTKKNKMAISLTFKKSEEKLFKDLKKIDNPTQLIKDLLRQHIYNEQTPVATQTAKMLIGVEDICRIVESATKNLTITQAPAATPNMSYQIPVEETQVANEVNDKDGQNEEPFGFLKNKDLDNDIINSFN